MLTLGFHPLFTMPCDDLIITAVLACSYHVNNYFQMGGPSTSVFQLRDRDMHGFLFILLTYAYKLNSLSNYKSLKVDHS